MMDNFYFPYEIAAFTLAEKEEYLRKRQKDVFEIRQTLEKMRKEAHQRLLQETYAHRVTPYSTSARFAARRTSKMPDKKKVVAMAGFKPADHIEVATISQNGIVVLWDAATGLKYEAMNIGKGNTNTMDVSENGSILAAGGLSCIVEVYTVGDNLRRMTGRSDQTTLRLTDSVEEWDFSQRPPQYRMGFGQHAAAITSVKFLDSFRLASAAENGSIYVFDLHQEAAIDDQAVKGTIKTMDKDEENGISAVGTAEGSLEILDSRMDSGSAQKIKRKEEINAVRFMPGGNSVLCTRTNGLILYDLRSCSTLQTYNYPGDSITALDISASGRLAIVGTDAGNMAPLDLIQNKWLASLPGHRETVSDVCIVDGTAITSSWDGTTRVYEFEK